MAQLTLPIVGDKGLCMPNNLHTLAKSSGLNCFSWSVCNCSGGEKQNFICDDSNNCNGFLVWDRICLCPSSEVVTDKDVSVPIL